MSTGNAVSVSGLSKSYRIAKNTGIRPSRATEAIVERLRHPLQRTEYESFSALSDVDFEIPWGEAVGIVGRNGAGKSTLLKLLTRITAPTRGRIELGGRVGSLLEVGTGFHPELTGRENVYLNGTLLGMRRGEINRRFDEIVDFSGVEKFLDTPVKRYSSGMYVRLAFAVAAHLETEILAIDEVLAVGDAEFQQKSLAKMRDAAKDGRTVLYVSHQMHTVTALCTSAIFLQSGRMMYHGDVDTALEQYRATYDSFVATQRQERSTVDTGTIRVSAVRLAESSFAVEEDKVIEIDTEPGAGVVGSYFVSVHLNDMNGTVVTQCDSRLVGLYLDPERGHQVTLTLTNLWLKPGRYSVDVFLCTAGVIDRWEGAATFEVLPTLPYPELTMGEAIGHGIVLSNFDYQATTS